ncbi:tetratricopeptide repeat protein 12 [Euwallacea similis]|uniref:tetratricopeptide repeat protein 12 n=1 Tax=Euwallacea similis TaxID=1736056 RepID=UPI00344DD5BF
MADNNQISSNFTNTDEEFSNFLQRVSEVHNIVQKLASKDPNLQKIGDEEARRYLKDGIAIESIDEEHIVLNITSNRTVVNKNVLSKDCREGSTSKESFMEEVSKDAEKRYRDRMVRTERMETFKKQASLAFRRAEYERALVLYNKAIEQIKDSVVLYNNRALTFIKLGFLDKAAKDLKEWALRLNENSLKSWLLLAKVHYHLEEFEEFHVCVAEVKKRNPEHEGFIEEYLSLNCGNMNKIVCN